jgi:hypothetical protein
VPEEAVARPSATLAALVRRIRLALIAAATLAVAVFAGAMAPPASAANSPSGAYDTPTSAYDTGVYVYDAPARLSSPNAMPADARGSPSGLGATSWGRSTFDRNRDVAANTATDSGARFVVNSAGDALDAARVSVPAGSSPWREPQLP